MPNRGPASSFFLASVAGWGGFVRILFCCAFFLGILYFLARKRGVDFFALGFFGGCFYFLPGLFGFVFAFNRFDPGGLSPQEILPQSYLVMTLVLVSLVVCAFFFDGKYGATPRPLISMPFWGSPQKWAALLGTVGFVASLVTTGHNLLDQDKGQMMLFLDRWNLLWEVGATVGLVLAFATRDRWGFGLCGLLLLADLGIGFRVNLMLAVLSLVMYMYSTKGAIRFVTQSRALALLALLAVFGFMFPGVAALAKIGDPSQIKQALADPNYYVNQLFVSEPFVIQSTLNEVIGANFRVGAGHLSSLVYVLVPFGNELGGKVVSFNDLFQERLFPGLEFGMAENIWAQAWSIGGMLAVVVFILVYLIGLWQGSKLLHSQGEYRRAFAVLFFTPWAFYLYRNDLLYQFMMERRILVMYAFAVLIAIIVGVLWPWPQAAEIRPPTRPAHCLGRHS